MKQIHLTRNRIALVDDEDFEKLNQFKWHTKIDKNNIYAVRNVRFGNKFKTIIMHREIMNAPKGIQVDHRNGDGLFNCKENLRLCNNQENGFNKKHPYKNNKLGIKGVYKTGNKFQTKIVVSGKRIHLGTFNVLGDADSAYRIAEEKYFGEFARGNSKIAV